MTTSFCAKSNIAHLSSASVSAPILLPLVYPLAATVEQNGTGLSITGGCVVSDSNRFGIDLVPGALMRIESRKSSGGGAGMSQALPPYFDRREATYNFHAWPEKHR